MQKGNYLLWTKKGRDSNTKWSVARDLQQPPRLNPLISTTEAEKLLCDSWAPVDHPEDNTLADEWEEMANEAGIVKINPVANYLDEANWDLLFSSFTDKLKWR